MSKSLGLFAAALPALLLLLLGYLEAGQGWVTTVGGMSQIGGVALVVITLSRAHGRFGELTLSGRTKRWIAAKIRRLMFWKKGQTIAMVGSATARATASMDARLIRGLNPDAPTDQRLSIIEDAIRDLQKEVGDVRGKVAEAKGEILQQLETEKRERVEAVRGIRGDMKNLALGDTPVNLLGVAWFFQGIAFATWPGYFLGLASGLFH
jgi:hypothetical protein